MSQDVLVVDDVGKAYVEFDHELRRLGRWFGLPFRPRAEHWVVRHVAFRVRAGEAVGIIGQNGAGKSTLLKMITGTALPNEGTIRLHGRVAALLELGLGFNAELTGRENVVQSAGLMGLSRERIDALLPEIEAFAEIGDYFDQPVRTYSSGMQMRVAFSVATAVRPDVLIVDEALSVGDAYFVHKCFQRIREFRDAGTTLLIVSHDAAAIQALCDRAILLDRGALVMDGDPSQVFDFYNALIADKENANVRTARTDDGRVQTESGTLEATIEGVELFDAAGQRVEYVAVGDEVELRATARIHANIDRLVFGYMIKDRLGQAMFGTNTHHTDQALDGLVPGTTVTFCARFRVHLGAGSYSVSVALTDAETHLVRNYQWRDLALLFTVANTAHPRFVGSAWLPPAIRVSRAD